MNLKPLTDAERLVPRRTPIQADEKTLAYPGAKEALKEAGFEPVIASRAPSQSWVPGHLRYLLHFYISTEPFPEPERSSQFYAESLGLFMDLDLIQYRDGIPTCTKRGEAFIRLLLNTPVPEERFTDPRNGEIV